MSDKRNESDEALGCSFCHDRFSNVIKFIPQCGNSICGRCYEHLKEDADEDSNNYKCPACDGEHTLSPNGLSDDQILLSFLENNHRKALSENAQKLEEKVSYVKIQLEKLESFDCSEYVRAHCEKIELEASEAIERAIKHLEEVEKNMMKQIREYREKCIENLTSRSSEQEYAEKQKLAELKNEVSEFDARWSEYFKRVETFEEESEIEAALAQTSVYLANMESMEKKLEYQALNWENIVFTENSQFLEEWNHVGKIEIIAEPKPEVDRVEPSGVSYLDERIKRPYLTFTGHSDTIRQVLFLPDVTLASCSHDGLIKIWNVENGKELFQLKSHADYVLSIASLANDHLASGSMYGTIRIWDLNRRKEMRAIQAHSNAVVSLKELKNKNLASYSNDDTIKIWNLDSSENEPVSTLTGHGNSNWGAQLFGVLSNDYLVTCSLQKDRKEQCILQIWNMNEPNPIKSVSTGFNDVWSLLVLWNDQVALGFNSGTIKIIDLGDENPVSRTIKRAHAKWVYSLAQLSNKILVSAGRDDANETIKVWNLLDLVLLRRFSTGQSWWIVSLSNVERILASASVDMTIKLWVINDN